MALPYRKIMADHADFKVGAMLVPKAKTVIAEQIHSAKVHICSTTDGGAGFDAHPQIMNCDALITDVPNLFLLIRTADCAPILFYDEANRCVGAVHSGREGTRKNIAGAAVSAMQETYGAKPENLAARIGACICKQHYKVNNTVWDHFAASCAEQGIRVPESDRPCLDIQSVIYQQLVTAGLDQCNIKQVSICTYESGSHFSFRRDGTRNRQINVIGIIDG